MIEMSQVANWKRNAWQACGYCRLCNRLSRAGAAPHEASHQLLYMQSSITFIYLFMAVSSI